MRIIDHRLFQPDDAPVRWKASPNHGGPLAPRYLVLHYTAGRSAETTADWLANPAAKASAHVVIGKDGSLVQLVPFNVVAWHAGKSAWTDGGVRLVGLNQHAIGIEMDNPGRLVRQGSRWRSLGLGTVYDDADVIEAQHKHEARPAGWHVFPPAQIDAAFDLAQLLVRTYGLTDILGHEDIAPGRKTDPGPAFPLESFRGRLLGRRDEQPDDRFVTTDAVNVRTGPGTEFAVIAPSPVPPRTNVQVLTAQGSWRQVDVLDVVGGTNDLQGWVHGRYLRPAT